MNDAAPAVVESSPRVVDWVMTHASLACPPVRFSRLGNGRSNLTYALEDSLGHRWVLRRPPAGTRLDSAHDVAREYRILQRLQYSEVPVPRPIAFAEEGELGDYALALIEYVEGYVVEDEHSARTLPLAIRHEAGLAMARTLARIHAVDLRARGLLDLASHASYAQRQLRRWLRQWDASSTCERPLVSELAERLGRAAPEHEELALVHGDFHIHNVIIDRDTGELRAVLDWELCTLGDPLADLGGLLAYWPERSDAVIPGPIVVTSLPGFPTRAEIVHAYGQASGRDVAGLDFWLALAYWKTAIIMEGVRRRMIDDPVSSGPPPADQMVGDLLELALDAARLCP
jgi:aminoglycoside phosphotransferase (APT) family kinase protein